MTDLLDIRPGRLMAEKEPAKEPEPGRLRLWRTGNWLRRACEKEIKNRVGNGPARSQKM
jgi:hypothetical protein